MGKSLEELYDPYEALFASQNMRFRRRQYREQTLLIVSSLVLLGALVRIGVLSVRWAREYDLNPDGREQ